MPGHPPQLRSDPCGRSTPAVSPHRTRTPPQQQETHDHDGPRPKPGPPAPHPGGVGTKKVCPAGDTPRDTPVHPAPQVGGSKRKSLHPKAEAISTTSKLDGQPVVPGDGLEDVVQEFCDETKHVGTFRVVAELLLSGGSLPIIDQLGPETQAKSANRS